MRVLHDLDTELHDAVVSQGFRVENFVFRGANGWTLGEHGTSDKAVRRERGMEEAGEQVCIASSRHGLWKALKGYVVGKYGGEVVEYRKVVCVEETAGGGKVAVTSEDGDGVEKNEVVDLVIGADGVKSQVRKALFGEDERYKPIYT